MSQPSVSPAAESPRRVLAGLLLCGVLVFLLGDTLLQRSRAFWEYCRERAWELELGQVLEAMPLLVEADLHTREPGSVCLAFLGNSVVHMAIDRSLLRRELGLERHEAVVLWLPGGMSWELAMLAEELEALRPRFLVYAVTPWVLYEGFQVEWLRFYDPRLALQLFGWRGLLAEHALHASRLLASQHVVLRHRAALRELLFGPLLREAGSRPPAEAELWRRDRREDKSRARPEDFSCDSLQLRALSLLARKLAEARLPLLVLSIPTIDALGASPELLGRFESCLASRARELGFRFLGPEVWPEFQPHDFFDEAHLGRSGSARFTRALLPHLRAFRRGGAQGARLTTALLPHPGPMPGESLAEQARAIR